MLKVIRATWKSLPPFEGPIFWKHGVGEKFPDKLVFILVLTGTILSLHIDPREVIVVTLVTVIRWHVGSY